MGAVDEAARVILRLTKQLAECEEQLKHVDWYKKYVKAKNELKEERRRQRTWRHCFISDLHAGSLYFDAPAFRKMVKRLEEEKLRCEVLHVVGDVVEGKFNHTGQLYEAFPFPVQRSVAVRSIVKLVEVLRPKTVHIIPGNHDRKYGFNLLDTVVQDLEEKLGKVEIQYHRDDDYYVTDNILVLHGITRSAGSDYTGLTPLIQNNLIPLALQHGADTIVLGHYHRSVIIRYMGRLIIALPSFQYTGKPLRNERGMIMMRGDEIKLITVEASDRRTLVEYWRGSVKV